MQFLVADLVYLLLLFAWTIYIPPVGRDFALLATPSDVGYPLGAALLRTQMALFGNVAMGYHVLTILLLYICVLLVFLLTRLATRGPWWLGSVAGVLFLAHPLKTAATLQLTGGVLDLLPAIIVLAALCAYAALRQAKGVSAWLAAVAPVVACAALGPSGQLIALGILAWETFATPAGERRWLRALCCAVPAIAIWTVQGHLSGLAEGNLLDRIYSWQFLFYPLGLSPRNADGLDSHALVMVLITLLSIAGALLVAWKSAHPAVRWGLAGALFMVLCIPGSVDPVHLSGGGALTLPCALAAIAAAGLCHAVMRHPRWPQTVVWLSTVLCVVFMVLQARENLSWVRAGRLVSEFQAAALRTYNADVQQELAVFPDIRMLGHVPVMLSESVRHTTPFSTVLPVQSLCFVDLFNDELESVSVMEYGVNRATLQLSGLPAPHFWSAVQLARRQDPGEPWRLWELAFPYRPALRGHCETLVIAPYQGAFPVSRIPFPQAH